MNNVFISGLVNGGFKQLKEDSVHFVLAQKGKDDELSLFNMVAYGEVAKRLEGVESGTRIAVQGRLSSEKLDEEGPYQNVIAVSRVISVGGTGTDYSHASIVAALTAKELKRVGSKALAVINADFKTTREFKKPNGEVTTYTSYFNGSIWSERAESLAESLPLVDERVFVTGTLRPRSYENKAGQEVFRIEIFVDTVDPVKDSLLTSVPQKYANADEKAVPAAPAARGPRTGAARGGGSSLRAAMSGTTPEPDGDTPF